MMEFALLALSVLNKQQRVQNVLALSDSDHIYYNNSYEKINQIFSLYGLSRQNYGSRHHRW